MKRISPVLWMLVGAVLAIYIPSIWAYGTLGRVVTLSLATVVIIGWIVYRYRKDTGYLLYLGGGSLSGLFWWGRSSLRSFLSNLGFRAIKLLIVIGAAGWLLLLLVRLVVLDFFDWALAMVTRTEPRRPLNLFA